MKETDWKELCAKLVEELHTYKVAHPEHDTQLIDSAKAKLYQDKFLSAQGIRDKFSLGENVYLFLLYDGTSVDGRGSGTYCGCTTNKVVAKRHWDKCKKNPYSTGRVLALTATEQQYIYSEKCWENYD
jgi:hypothetical protein